MKIISVVNSETNREVAAGASFDLPSGAVRCLLQRADGRMLHGDFGSLADVLAEFEVRSVAPCHLQQADLFWPAANETGSGAHPAPAA